MTFKNPFEYEAANNLSAEKVADYFIDDFNYSRFIQSRRNVFVTGERGSGKTMALLYSSSRIQRLVADRSNSKPSLEYIGVYVPCNTPLTYKPEFDLLDTFLAATLSEHLLVLSLAHSVLTTLAGIPDVLRDADEATLRVELAAVLAAEFSERLPFFDAVRVFIEAQIRETQRIAVSRELDAYYQETFSFASAIMPLLSVCRRHIPSLENSHFLLLIDDAQALSSLQLKALNSWIAFRDHSLFSFKVATTKVSLGSRRTASGGSILEGHDYTTIDLERPLHNRNTGFYQLAEKIIARRLTEVGIRTTPREFFPVNESMKAELEAAAERAHTLALEKYSSTNKKAISDFVYKYARAQYFRGRPRTANRPPYSGFETMVFLSTGVIRNLLEPCYWMYDRAISTAQADGATPSVIQIDPAIQTEIILERSDNAWQWLRDRLSKDIEGCSVKDGDRAFHLLDGLADHFRERLLGDGAEPGALSFTISRQRSSAMSRLKPILDILRRAQMLYVRTGTAKDRGKREPYYVPNRILWPARGLDPHGQHARVSLTSDSLWHIAETGRFASSEEGGAGSSVVGQAELWNDDEQ